MKFYVHYEIGEPEFTLPITVNPSTEERCVSDIKSEFISAYNSRFSDNTLDPELYSLSLSKHKVLSGSDLIVSVVKPNTDVYVILRKSDSKTGKTGHPEVEESKKNPSKQSAGISTSSRGVSNNSVQSNSSPAQRPSAAPKPAAVETKPKWTRPKPMDLTVPPQVTKVWLQSRIIFQTCTDLTIRFLSWQWVKDSLRLASQVKAKGSLRQVHPRCMCFSTLIFHAADRPGARHALCGEQSSACMPRQNMMTRAHRPRFFLGRRRAMPGGRS
jgi:hypothetical protein